LTHVCAYRS